MKFTEYSDWRLAKLIGRVDSGFGMPLRLNTYEFDKKKCEEHGVEYKEGKFWGIDVDDVGRDATETNEKGARKVNLEKLVPFLLMKIYELENRRR